MRMKSITPQMFNMQRTCAEEGWRLGFNADNQAKPFPPKPENVKIYTPQWCVAFGMEWCLMSDMTWTLSDAPNTLNRVLISFFFFFASIALIWYLVFVFEWVLWVEMRMMLLTRGSMVCTCQNKKKWQNPEITLALNKSSVSWKHTLLTLSCSLFFRSFVIWFALVTLCP